MLCVRFAASGAKVPRQRRPSIARAPALKSGHSDPPPPMPATTPPHPDTPAPTRPSPKALYGRRTGHFCRMQGSQRTRQSLHPRLPIIERKRDATASARLQDRRQIAGLCQRILRHGHGHRKWQASALQRSQHFGFDRNGRVGPLWLDALQHQLERLRARPLDFEQMRVRRKAAKQPHGAFYPTRAGHRSQHPIQGALR